MEILEFQRRIQQNPLFSSWKCPKEIWTECLSDNLLHRQCKPTQRAVGFGQGSWRLQENQRYKTPYYCWQSRQSASCPYHLCKYQRRQGMPWYDCRGKAQVSVLERNARRQRLQGRRCDQNRTGAWHEFRMHQIQRRRSQIRTGSGALGGGAFNLVAWQLPKTCPQLWERMCHRLVYDRYCGSIQVVSIHLIFLMVIWSAVSSGSTGLSRLCSNIVAIEFYIRNPTDIKVTLVRRFWAYFERFHRLRCPHRALFNFQNLHQKRHPYDLEILRNAL